MSAGKTTVAAKKKRAQRSPKVEFWVGIGASAGGLEALRSFVRNLSGDTGASYIVAQHMAPHHRSMLSEITGRETELPVLDVVDRLVPKPDTIYITPPNHNIVFEKNRLRLIDPSPEPAAPKPSVDRFFSSLAEAKGERAIGIILSGTGSDGAQGMRAIRAAGGVTVAQDEMTAKYTSMPVKAIETGCVDLVMSPDEMGVQFQKIMSLPRDLESLKASPIDLDNVSELIQLLLKETKVNFRHYKTATFQRRVERRMAALKVGNLEDYVSIAKSSPREVQLLFQDLLISVTSFFRDPAEFDALRSHIATIVERKKDDFIRVWIPGTATGEEAYTIAILFAEAVGGAKAFASTKIQIFATDIDANAIEVARRGFYPELALDVINPNIVSEYFDTAPTGYSVRKVIREKIVFSIHNVAQDPPFLNLDLVSCRNLLIYFQSSLQAQVFSRFHYALAATGILFLGKSEAVGASESLFRISSPDKHIFTKRPSLERTAFPEPFFDKPKIQRSTTTNYPPPEARELVIANAKFDGLVKALGGNGLLITSDMQVRKAYGDVDQYIGLSSGTVSTSALSLLREPFRQDVRIALPAAMRSMAHVRGAARPDKGNPELRRRINVYPIDSGPGEEQVALVIFNEWEEPVAVAEENADPSVQGYRQQLDELTEELTIARSNLQQTVEELETSNEELQALNEELQSSNEELQSTNEELETSNEELQSTNEELITVNEELQVNSQQLNDINQSLHSILDNITIPMIVVDRGLNITNMSREAETVFGVSSDLSLPHVSRCSLPPGYPNLTDALNQAMASGNRLDLSINHDDASAILTVAPHFSSADELVGAIVLLRDDTLDLKTTRAELQVIFDNVPLAIMVRDEEGRIIKANPHSNALLGSQGHETTGKLFYDFFDQETADQFKQDDLDVLRSGEPTIGLLRQAVFKHGSTAWVRMSRIIKEHPSTGKPTIFAVTQNVTEQQQAEDLLKTSQKRLDLAVASSGVGLWEWDVESNALYWSDRFKDIVGVDETTFGGTLDDFSDRLHPEDRDTVLAAVQSHVDNNTPYAIVYRLRHEDGSYRWIQAYGKASRDEAGKALKFVGTVEDITSDRLTLMALRERNQQLTLASSLSGLGYWKIDLIDNSVFWSDQIFVIHGVSPDDYEPELESAIKFYHPDDVDRVQTLVQEALAKGGAFDFEARIVRPNGEVRHVHSTCSPDLAEDGKPTAVFGVFLDYTDVKLREDKLKETLAELSQSNEELNRFSYVCSHDMKEPVRMIEAMSGLLLAPEFELDDDKRVEILERINNNTGRLRGIIDGLLAYSRIDSAMERGPVDLNSVLSDVLDALSLVIKEKDATIDSGPLPTVEGARVHFSQLFQNLIGNGLKFSDKPSPKIEVTAEKRGDRYIFSVQDNGPGVPEAQRSTIFAVFNRLKRRDEIEGTGLGLSIAQRIVSQYGGTIRCTEGSMGGANFVFDIPVEIEATATLEQLATGT